MSQSKKNRYIGKHIAGRYCITGEIGSGGMGHVLSAMPFDDPSRDVAIKIILHQKQLKPENVARFQKEASLMSRLKHENIICFHELGWIREDNSPFGYSGYFIVMEIARGSTLRHILDSVGRRDADEFFKIAKQIASALDYTHGKGIIHRDIKPHNIIVDEQLFVKILDFGVARLDEALHKNHTDMTRTSQSRKNDFAGTPLYMAPEQTDLVSYPSDHRVDLYSLGCVLYEMMAGKPPFNASRKEALFNQHAFDEPEPLYHIRPNLPPIVGNIIHKLLTKDPNQRYQSAFSLFTDIVKAEQLCHNNKRFHTVNFPIAKNDHFNAVGNQTVYLDRNKILENLTETYQKALTQDARPHMSLVVGKTGAGKSRMLMELRTKLTLTRTPFISINFSRHELGLPYNAIATGFNEYLLKVARFQPGEAEEIRSRIKSILGNSAFEIARVIPGIKPFLKMDLEEKFDDENIVSDTFSKSFSDFIRCIASDAAPIVFIFDDIHWADHQTVDLINHFIAYNNTMRFLTVMTCNQDEIDKNKRLQEFFLKFSKLKRRFHQIEIQNFHIEDTHQYVASLLNTDQKNIKIDLINYIQEKTWGNPLAVNAFARKLVIKNCLVYDSGAWFYNIDDILRKKIDLNLVDLALKNLSEVGVEVSLPIKVASVIGDQFSSVMLGQISDFTPERVAKAMRFAEKNSIIKVQKNLSGDHVTYVFTHWNTRREIYESLPAEERKQIHEKIATTHLQRKDVDVITDKDIFDMTHHLNLAIRSEFSVDNALLAEAVELNQKSGDRASRLEAWPSAQQYYENAINYSKKLNRKPREYVSIFLRLGNVLFYQSAFKPAMQLLSEFPREQLELQTYFEIEIQKLRIYFAGGFVSKNAKIVSQLLTRISSSVHKSLRLKAGIYHRLELFLQLFRMDFLSVGLNKAYQKGVRSHLPSQNRMLRWFLNIEKQSFRIPHSAAFRNWMYLLAVEERFNTSASCEMALQRIVDLKRIFPLPMQERNFNLLMSIARARGDTHLFGLTALTRALHSCYSEQKFDDLERYVRYSKQYLNTSNNIKSKVDSFILDISMHVFKGSVEKLPLYLKHLPEAIQTRHPSSPKALLKIILIYFIYDQHDQVVRIADLYLKRRKEVGGRDSDSYQQMIVALRHISCGENKKAMLVLHEAIASFSLRSFRYELYAHEKDIVMLFFLLIDIQQKNINFITPFLEKFLAKGYFRFEKKTTIFRLAYFYTKPWKVTNFKKFHEANTLARAFRHKVTYSLSLYMMQSVAGKIRRQGTTDLSVTELKNRLIEQDVPFFLEHSGLKNKTVVPVSKNELVQDHTRYRSFFDLVYLYSSIQEGRITVPDILQKILENVDQNFRCQRLYFILRSHKTKHTFIVRYPEGDDGLDDQVIRNYVEPYFQIRSTLFIPSQDAPWVQNADPLMQTSPVSSFKDTEDTVEKTRVAATFRNTQDEMTASSSLPSRLQMQMSALVPANSDNWESLVLLEDVHVFEQSTYLKSELDFLSCLFSLMLDLPEFYTVMRSQVLLQDSLHKIKHNSFSYEIGTCNLERSDWLQLSFQGPLRTKRETGFYLGFNLTEDRYLLSYCRLNGPQDKRQFMGRCIWYLTYSLQQLDQKIPDFNMQSIQDILTAFFQQTSDVPALEGIALNFSLFDKAKNQVESLHYGPSRPFVCDKSNQIRPNNDAIQQLDNGKELRSWRILASLEGFHIYFNAHDTSQFDLLLSEEQKRKIAEQMLVDMDPKFVSNVNIHETLSQTLPTEALPRYYVAAWNKEAIEKFFEGADHLTQAS